MTETRRRSATCTPSLPFDEAARAAAGCAPATAVPHCGQKRAPATRAVPQDTHAWATGLPHCMQKRAPSTTSDPQLAQMIAKPTLVVIVSTFDPSTL
jgi:hypothetical protein